MSNVDYSFVRYDAPVDEKVMTEVDQLLGGYGEHYPMTFGKDYKNRCTGMHNVGVLMFVAKHQGNIVAHASVLYARNNPSVSALHNVFTSVDHRRKGLSTRLVKLVLETFDKEMDGKFETGYMVLGTGSPSAARIYSSHGFEHLAGGLDTPGGAKGYNPDDLGEWIMIRKSGSKKKAFDAKAYYTLGDDSGTSVVPCSLSHYTQLVLLFNACEKEEKNMESLSIKDGIHAEGSLVKLYTTPVKYDIENDKTRNVFVCICNEKVVGIASWNPAKEIWDAYSPFKVAENCLLKFCENIEK